MTGNQVMGGGFRIALDGDGRISGFRRIAFGNKIATLKVSEDVSFYS